MTLPDAIEHAARELPAGLTAEEMADAREHRVILAIKKCRNRANVTLFEAKDRVETYLRHIGRIKP